MQPETKARLDEIAAQAKRQHEADRQRANEDAKALMAFRHAFREAATRAANTADEMGRHLKNAAGFDYKVDDALFRQQRSEPDSPMEWGFLLAPPGHSLQSHGTHGRFVLRADLAGRAAVVEEWLVLPDREPLVVAKARSHAAEQLTAEALEILLAGFAHRTVQAMRPPEAAAGDPGK